MPRGPQGQGRWHPLLLYRGTAAVSNGVMVAQHRGHAGGSVLPAPPATDANQVQGLVLLLKSAVQMGLLHHTGGL